MPTIMISYARKDARDFAQKLADSLTANGIPTWLDTSHIEGGAQWLRELEKGLDSADTVLAIRTPAARQSEWVCRERLYALKHNKRIIPLLLKDCPDDLEFIDLQPIDFRGDFDTAFQQLLDLLHRDPIKTTDRRAFERAYLVKLLLEYHIWQTLYTPMAGVAQMWVESADDDIEMVTGSAEIDMLLTRIDQHFPDEKPRQIATQPKPYTDILDALHDMRQLLILGEPGSGKTTTLWRIAADHAQKALADETYPLPIFVRFGEMESGDDWQTYLAQQLGYDLAPHLADLMHDDEPRLIYLLDGLNELPSADKSWRDQIVTHLRQLVAQCQQKDGLLAVTCRELDYIQDIDLNIPERILIEPLDPVRIRTFVNNYIQKPPGKGHELFWQLAGDSALEQWQKFSEKFTDLDNIETIFWLNDTLPDGHYWGYWEDNNSYWEVWLAERRHPRNMLSLARNPYMLFMMTRVFTKQKRLPQNRGLLFEGFINYLLLEREKMSQAAAETLKSHLADLAYAMQAQGVGTGFSEKQVLTAGLTTPHLYQARSANILTTGDPTRFTHQLLQEYFAAQRLNREMINGTPVTQFFPSETWWQPTGWEETAILLAGLYSDNCTPVINWLKTAQPELSARCILESGAQIPDTAYNDLRLRELWLPRLTNLTTDPQPPARVAIGRALGSLDTDTTRGQRSRPILDTRLGVGLRDDSLPDMVWCEVPAGPFLMGSDRQKENLARDNEPDLHQRTLPAFYIARYPVTYAQYEAFVAADGYTNRGYWTEAGWDWKGPKTNPEAYWNHPDWHIANHPVVGVTWYEAYAFTQWLSAQLGYAVRLPTESEWEKAARGTDGRIYPYGNDFDPTKANTSETGIRHTSPVGIFPDGGTPYPQPAYDMSGNVFEWCQSVYNSSYQFPEDNSGDGTNVRVLRGGSWATLSARGLPSASGTSPDDRYSFLGFRCARSY